MFGAYSIRQAALADAATIVDHRRGMFISMGVEEAALRPFDAAFHAWVSVHLQQGSYVGWLTEHQSEVVAGAGLWVHEWMPGVNAPTGVRGYILNVYTAPEHRRRGLAAHLVEQCIEVCRQRGIPVVGLHASDEGRPIYERMGFLPTNEMRLLLT
ncbi:MAG: GNAT family N-acetyltransferase [Chloroflexi bacterium]|nr:GNAT family N-acetyltransferase [Chloroflexota bacterium]